MNGKSDFEHEDRLRARLRELDGIALAPYAAVRARAGRRRSSSRAFALAASAVALIIGGAIVGDRLRESRAIEAANATAANGDCGAQTSQLDPAGRLVGVTKDPTTILVGTFSAYVRPQVETFFFWHMTSAPATAPLTVYAQYGDRPRIAPSSIVTVGPNESVVSFVFPKSGCWRLHAERDGGKLSGDVWLHVLADGATASPTYANADCSALSRRDATGRLIGTTLDSTTILVGLPADVRPVVEITFDWHMTSGLLIDPLTVYAQHGDGSRVTPRLIETVGPDDFLVHLAVPVSGCWRLHSERTGGKLSGDVWLQVPPSR